MTPRPRSLPATSTKPARPIAALLAAGVVLVSATACGSTSGDTAGSGSASGGASAGTVTISDCGQNEQYPSPAQRMFVNDAGMIAMVMAVGGTNQIGSYSSLNRDRTVLSRHYGALPTQAKDLGAQMPALETLLAARPDVVFAGWNYGFKEGGVTPESLTGKKIPVYQLTEACRQKQGQAARGTVEPWTALKTDLTNLGRMTGHEDKASAVNADIDRRRAALDAAPKATKKPQVLLFDSGEKDVFTSGKFGGPQAVIETAGARNVMDDVADTWTSVSWERIAATKPDVIAFVEYGTQTFAQKVAALEANPATKNLEAVKQKRYINLPYAMWVSSPLNIDAAEQLHHRLEQWKFLPASKLPAPKENDHVAVSPTS